MDAVGKATQSKILAERLGATLFTFPDYTTPAGEAILSNLKSGWTAASSEKLVGKPYFSYSAEPKINALVLQSLMLTNRLERGAQLRTASFRGHVVLDRYDASAMVYGALDGLDLDWITSTNAQLPVRPDVYILLDAPVEESFRRRPERRDRYESNRPYLEKVRVEYLRLFTEKHEANLRRAQGDGKTRSTFIPGPAWRVVDAMGTVEEVSARVWAATGR